MILKTNARAKWDFSINIYVPSWSKNSWCICEGKAKLIHSMNDAKEAIYGFLPHDSPVFYTHEYNLC